jgi:pantoate--beta-alanine ligase
VIATVVELARLRDTIDGWKRDDLRVGFVPTMGNLHAGHMSLIELARRHCDRVVASVFVNPTQFGPGEDFARYPRTPEADARALATAGCDLMWLPSVETMYPHGIESTASVRVPVITGTLEGAHRPGHFDGVATVVSKLFTQVRPDAAVFGRKDYQQLAMIRYLVRDLAFAVDIVAGNTLREPDGLAMSSRNQYLSPSERPVATTVHHVLQSMRRQCLEGLPLDDVEAGATRKLQDSGFQVDYAVVRNADLGVVDAREPGPRVALIAARLGRTRLIDNLEFSAP